MEYRKEITDYGVTVYSAIQSDYSHELQVTVSKGLIARIAMHPKPVQDNRIIIEKSEYAAAFNKSVDTFTDYLKI